MGRPWSVNKSRRKEAVIACAQMASSNDREGLGPVFSIENNVAAHPKVIALAKAAFDMVYGPNNRLPAGYVYDTIREAWAEAAQLLRDGWTPGEDLITMEEALASRIRRRDKEAPPDAQSPEEAELDLIVEERHDKMNDMNLPADIETCNMRTHEVRTIDDGPVTCDPEICSDDCPMSEPRIEHNPALDVVEVTDEFNEAAYGDSSVEPEEQYTEPEDAGEPKNKPTTDG